MAKPKVAQGEDVNAHLTDSSPAFSKTQILDSTKYAKRRDLLAVLLKDDKAYTTLEVASLINNFMKGVI